MSNHNFISYSSVDALKFAFELHDSLLAGPPSIPVWLDKREIKPGQDWDEQIVEAIRTCESLIFLMTSDSVEPKSVCKLEWTRALKYKKAIVPILLQPEVEMPFRLGSRQCIDFTGDFDTGLAKLRKHLRWLASPDGVLQSLKYRHEDAQRDLRRTKDSTPQNRIQKEIAFLKEQINDQQCLIDDPGAAAMRVEQSITWGIERERQPEMETAASTLKEKILTKVFDVFLCHNTKDKSNVKKIGEQLKECGILPWLDEWELRPGLPWQGILEQQFEQIKSAAVFIGKDGIGPWHQMELDAFLREFVNRGCPVIPVLLPNAPNEPELPIFLKAMTWVDFRKGKPDPMERLVWGITGEPVRGMTRTKFINPAPIIAPTYFQDRYVETNLISDFLKNDAQRLMTIVGRAGIGKTAMVCRLLKSLEGGRLPDNGEEMSIDGIIYLSETGTRKVTVPNLYADLCSLLPDNIAKRLDEVYRDPKTSTESKMQALMEAFPSGQVLLLLDNFENLIDPLTHNLTNTEMDEALKAILDLPPHGVKVIITTRVAPRDMALIHPQRQFRLDLEKGLESPYAENILREMDADGTVGLKDAPDELLNKARERTLGNPRALEALFAILSADRDTELQEILSDSELLPENVVEVLVGEAFSRLDPTARKVMEALAIYSRPVSPSAVDSLLQLYVPGVDSARVLNRLVNMKFVRKEAGRYYMHPVDKEYALSRMPEGDASDRDEPVFTHFSLLHLGADYFKEARMPVENRKTIDDLSAQLAEFDLRYAGQDYDTAADVLADIDYDYLLLWGHYRVMTELHERLQGKLNDPKLKSYSVGNLGTTYYYLGDYQKAIEYFEQALIISREIGDRSGEGADLGNLGIAYSNLGQVEKAIEYYEQALVIAREIGDRRGEGNQLGNLGIAYSNLGQVEKAIEYYEQALVITREIGDRSGEGNQLGNLGSAYSNLGQVEKAIEYYEQALVIAREIEDRDGEGNRLGNLGIAYSNLGQVEKAIEYYEQALIISREIGDRRGEGADLGNLGNAYIDMGQVQSAKAYHKQALEIAQEIGDRYLEANELINTGDMFSDISEFENAVKFYKQAIAIADEIKIVQPQNEARWGLAQSQLFSGDLENARSTAESARRYDYPLNNHNVLVLMGVIALQQGDSASAKDAFETTVKASDALLGHNEQNYGALDAKGLALCGLALCDEDTNYIPDAISSYEAARFITRVPGIVGRVLQLFDELVKADTQELLSGVREEAGGK
jgi:tetratricopeptide (TPR) repeat protein